MDATAADPYAHLDPLPPTLREGDYFLLYFADGRQLFAQCLPKWRANKTFPPCKINKKTYWTNNLIGLPYGTVLEVGRDTLIPLPEGEDLLPGAPEVVIEAAKDGAHSKNDIQSTDNGKNGSKDNAHNDNRNLIDDNTSQKLTYEHVNKLMKESSHGSDIVKALISNSSTFESKTAFSQAKYVKRKQMKHQRRCRIVRVTPATLCSAMHLKDSKRISNLREDTLGQIISNANVCAGQRILIMDTAVQGIITASCTRRMGGYGSVISLYAGQQPGYLDVVKRMNFTLGEMQSLKWVSLSEVFADYDKKDEQTKSLCDENGVIQDVERRDRERIEWPAPLQPHTRNYLLNELQSDEKVEEFLSRRSARFTRKLTRHSMLELRELIDGCRDKEENLDSRCVYKSEEGREKDEEMGHDAPVDDTSKTNDSQSNDDNNPRQCDSLIIATKYDPTATLIRLLPYLAPSCPFVIFHEFLEPLLETFRTLQNYYHVDSNDNDKNGETTTTTHNKQRAPPPMMQRRNIAINLRLTDTWFREYQVLDGRTHPNMSMSQNGGYVLMGTKLCPRTGTNELDEEERKEIRARFGGRRKRQKGSGGKNKRKGDDDGAEKSKDGAADAKRAKKESSETSN